MGLGHSHSHVGTHGSPTRSNARALLLVLVLTTTYMVAEVVAGVLTGSLALLADAGHMISDSGSILLALVAISLAGRPATSKRSFGYKRAEILAALVNGATLVAISLWIFIEAARRLSNPPDVAGRWMLVVALGGVIINLTGAAILARAGREAGMGEVDRWRAHPWLGMLLRLLALLVPIAVGVGAAVLLATSLPEASTVAGRAYSTSRRSMRGIKHSTRRDMSSQ